MAEDNLTNFHYAYVDLIRHWHPESEHFTGGDALFTALSNGWTIGDTVRYEEYWLRGGRSVVVYYFELKCDDETRVMPILSNPYIRRLLNSLTVKIIALDEKKASSATHH